MNFKVGELILKFKYGGYYTGLRQPQHNSHFTWQVPASELAMLTKRLCVEFSPQSFYFIRQLIDEAKNFTSL